MARRFALLFNLNLLMFCAVLFSFVFTVACGEKPETVKPKAVDQVIARVDGRPIKRSSLERALKVLLYHGDATLDEKEELDDEEIKELKKSILNELIEEEIVIDQASKRDISIGNQELYDIIAAMMGNTDQESFNNAIVPLYGSLEIWREDMERKLLIARVIDDVKGSVKKVTAGEVSKYYIRNEEEYKVPEQVKAAMILLATKEAADKVKKKLDDGEDFAKLAKEFSISPEGAIGGELGVFSLGEMPKEFEEIVFKIPLRTPSKVLKTGYGYHIFLVKERKKGRKLKFQDVKADIKGMLTAERAEEKLMQWIRALKKKASIEILEEI